MVRVEDSPSPVYGAALLMRLGLTPFRGSNPRSSANLDITQRWFALTSRQFRKVIKVP